MAEVESRVVDLELRFMKLERFAEELSGVVAEQGRTIDRLSLETERLRARLSQQVEGEPLPNEKPPHY